MTGSTPVPVRRSALPLRLATSFGLLIAIAWWVEPGALLDRVATIAPGWIMLALVISIPQVLLSAWRWQLTAGCLGAAIPLGEAVREYYLGSFVNQIMPGGVMGDAARAWRHARTLPSAREAWHAVLIERASGQLALLLCAALALACSPAFATNLLAALVRGWGGAPAAMMIVAGVLALALLAVLIRRPGARLRQFAHDIGRGLLASRVWPRQAVASLLVVASYVAVFVCCARAIGDQTPVTTLAPLLTLVLMAMAIPVSVAGWGVREGTAALVWIIAGHEPGQGVAISIIYGAVVLVSTLPGAWALSAGGRDAGAAVQPSPPRLP